MDIKGKIIQKLDPQSGTSKAGNAWKKQEYVLETMDSFPRKVKFDFFGDRADQYPLEVGDVITLSYDIESREFNGRWYTDIRGWKAEKIDPNAVQQAPAQAMPASAPAPASPAPAGPAPTGPDAPPAQDFMDGAGNDDLPF
jgi:hypothetical protein